ncbi:MAG: DNA polymerase III subunit beta [Sphingobacteriia bacterium]
MKFIVSSGELLKHVSAIQGVVSPKAVLPIIQNILLELKDGQLRLTATDLENSLQTALKVETDGSESMAVCLPAKILADTLKALPEQPITFSMDANSFAVTVTSDTGTYKIHGVDGGDFPKIPAADNTTSITIPLGNLVKAINMTLFATSSDELKPAMTGVLFKFGAEHATFVATDAHRLVRYRRTDIRVPEEVEFILPQKALKLLTNAAQNSSEDAVQIEYNSSNAFFKFANTLLVSRQIDARFPDYENVIPAGSPNKAMVDKQELLGTMRRSDIYSNKTTHLGRFKFSGNLLEVQAEDLDFANESKENLNCLYEGEELEIGFNVSLMMDVIDTVPTDEVVVEMDSSNRAAVVLPSSQEEGENVLMLLMPVMLGVTY